MSDSDDLTPFGSIFPGPVDPATPTSASAAPAPAEGPEQPVGMPSMPPPPAHPEPAAIEEPATGIDGEEQGSSPVAVLSPSHPRYELGNDWQFGATNGPNLPVRLPGSRKSIALALVVVLVAAAGVYLFLNRSNSTGGTALALTLSRGQTYGYHMDMSFNGTIKLAGQAAPVTMQFAEDFTWKVESVDSNGVATVTMTVTSLSSTINGKLSPAEGPLTVEVRVAKDGRILTAGNLAVTGVSNNTEAFPGTDQFLPLLPDHPVKPGDAWDKTFDQDFPFGTGKIHYVAHNSYLRNENVGGVQAAVIAGTVRIPLDLTIDPAEISKAVGVSADPFAPKGAKVLFSGTMDLTQTAWLDIAKHTLLKGSISGTMDMTIELKGVPAPAEVPDGKIGFAGTVTMQIKAAEGAPAQIPAATNAKDQAAQSELRNALSASKTYFADRNSYVGLSPKALRQIERSLAYNTASRAKKGEVSIRDVSKNVVLLVIKSDSGKTFCLADDVTSGVVYGTQDAKKAADCTGGW
jgi:hypothetical protein